MKCGLTMKRQTLKDYKSEHQLFANRSWIAMIFIFLIIGVIVFRLSDLQIIKHQFYSTLSKQNVVNVVPIDANRGLIYDRNGVLVATNIPIYSLDVIPARVANLNKTLNALNALIHLDPSDIQQFRRSLRQYHPYQPIPLKLKLNEEEAAKFYVNQYRFPGVLIQSRMIRYYPLGETMGNVLGYVGRINTKELTQVDKENYNPSAYIGKTGIEKYYESNLHGQVGAEEVEIDASGRIVRTLKSIPPTPGDDLYLTIDSKLQAFALKALGDNTGSVVAIQPATGAVLALVTKPGYDPNPFVMGIKHQDYLQLLNSPQHPLYNRAIRGLYSPGSTIKPVFAIEGLNSGVINPQFKIYDFGWFRLPNSQHPFRDWVKFGHGSVNVTKAIVVSCDVFFYNLAVNLGINRMDDILTRFGFGKPTGIDLIDELKGIVPSPRWKWIAQGKSWYPGDTVITGIGQGSLLVTPLQLAAAVATIAERGIRLQPHVLLQSVAPDGSINKQAPVPETPVVLNDNSIWNTVIQGMIGVASGPPGTATAFRDNPGYTVAAKTGTAQVFGNRDEETIQTNLPLQLRNNHLFIVFAPVEQPQIAVAIVVEHAGAADKIARDVIDYYFQEINLIPKPVQQEVQNAARSAIETAPAHLQLPAQNLSPATTVTPALPAQNTLPTTPAIPTAQQQ